MHAGLGEFAHGDGTDPLYLLRWDVAEVRERAIRGVGDWLHAGMLVDGTDKRHIGAPTSGNATIAASLTHRLRRFPTHGIQM